MEKSFPFNAETVDGVADRVYSAEDFAADRAAYVTNGVLTSDSLVCSPAGGMTVKVSPGNAVINGYGYRNTDQCVFTLSAASALLPRIDAVMLRLDLGARNIALVLREGEHSTSPTAPSPTVGEGITEICIATVEVAIGMDSVNAEAISDRRPRAEHIPSVRRGGERVMLVRYGQPGEYVFRTAEYPSVGGRYELELQGGGGGGGSSPYQSSSGAGGGAGAHFSAAVTLSENAEVNVEVGGGGMGGEFGTDGAKGGDSRFGGYTASGGSGGGSGDANTAAPGGEGGTSGAFCGEDGAAGAISLTADSAGFSYVGAGGSSFFGMGGSSIFKDGLVTSSAGNSGDGFGSGGGGGGGVSSSAVGGSGGGGFVTVYGYVAE